MRALDDTMGIKTTKDFHGERVSRGAKVSIINLGCARNLVDTQTILGRLQRHGHCIVGLDQSDVAIVNTCAFIDEAKKESIDTILDLIALKKKGRIKKIIVAGCLAQRYSKELRREFKEVDAFMGVQKLDREWIPGSESRGIKTGIVEGLTPRHLAYVKICESCYNRCRFCIIPAIKGKFVSRSMESVVREVEHLDSQGVKEINIIGQDITAYGMDIYREKALAGLLRKVAAAAKGIQWIRLLYTFPAHVTDDLIGTIAREPKICKYIDIPLQHISDKLLLSMNRSITARQTKDLIRKIRSRIPGVYLRTTFIVGLPGETQDDFEELMQFVREEQFDRVGAFLYSREEGTPAYDMPGQVPEEIKKRRWDALMALQREISRSLQERLIGETLPVLIDEIEATEGRYAESAVAAQHSAKQKQDGTADVYLGRTPFDAPEVDGLVYVHSRRTLKPGEMVSVTIQDIYEYDLVGNVL
jgi:ribosomal protein S12 methylthiotransferase